MPSNKMQGFTLRDNELWRRREFKSLSDKGRLLILYLRSCPHANNTGLFHLPAEYINGDLGWNPVEIAAALREITDPHQFALYDPKTEFIWLPNRLKEFGVQNANQSKNAINLLKKVPDNFVYIGHYSKMLLAAFAWKGDALKYIREKSGLSAGEMGAYVSEKGEVLDGEVYTRFHQFWHAFSHYTNKNKAADAWLAINPGDDLFEDIVYAARQEAKAREQSASAGKPVTSPQGWLNAKRWEKWLDLRSQSGQADVPVVDWDRVGESLGLKWEMGESHEDFKQRVIITWRDMQAQANQETEDANTWRTQ